MRTPMDESIIIMLLLVTRSGTQRQPRLALMHTPDNGFILKLKQGFANPVRAGFDQFVVQPHLQFCHAIELNLSQRP